MKSEPSSEEQRAKPKKLKKLKSTTIILWRYFVLFTLCLLLIIFAASYLIMDRAVNKYAKRRIEEVGEEISLLLTDDSIEQSKIELAVLKYATTDVTDVYVFDNGGGLVFGDVSVSSQTLAELFTSLTANVGEWKTDKSVQFITRVEKGNVLNLGECVTYGGNECILLVRFPITSINGLVKRLELYVLIVGLAAFVIAFFISYTLAKKLSSPIKDVSETAEKLAKGDYTVQFNSLEYDEIAKLSDTLNYMKDEIQKTDEFRKELLANVSHDLKTPLTMIKAYASMVQEISGDDPKKRQKHIQVIIDECDRLAGLVEDILSTSKINSGLEQLNKKVFNLTELLYGVINSFGYLQEGQGYNIMVDVDANQYTYADEEKIKQVIYNLMSNAVNYTGADKTVYVSLKFVPHENVLHFAVRDTGAGIPEEELAHIWDRYFRSKETHNRPVKGTGLGLNIVKVILQNHSFNFGVNSKEGKGSTFFVDFPAVSSEPTPLTPELK